MDYIVLVDVRKRPQPSMYSSSSVNALAGYKFSSIVLKTVTEVISGITYTITWVQLPDTTWIPLFYKGVTYVKEVEVLYSYILPIEVVIDGRRYRTVGDAIPIELVE